MALMRTGGAGSAGLAIGLLLVAGFAIGAGEPRVELALDRDEATVGDRIAVSATILPAEACVSTPEPPGPEWGPFAVTDLGWRRPAEGAANSSWNWSGEVVAFRTGELELPARQWVCGGPEGETLLSSEAIAIRIVSVLGAEEAEPEIADIKDPVSMPRQLKALWIAVGILVGLALLAGLLAWLHRRYARALAAVEVPDDPFHRVPPHEWVYRAMQELLDRRLAEQGEVDRFYAELSAILKRYLGGRYRVDLIERTSAEVVQLLDQAGAPMRAVDSVRAVLAESDGAKFAKESPGPDRWRASVEKVYAVVDATRPAEPEPATDSVATPGAA